MAPPLLQLSDIALTFGGHPLLDGVELSVSAGERVCLVGRNGSGKSTLLKIVAGLVEPDRGERFIQPGAVIRYLPQEPDFAGHATTLSYVEAGLTASDDAHQARYLLQQLGMTGEEDPTNLSGGEARRVALARVLAPQPDILLLDEPTNHLDMPTIEWLEGTLANQRGALVIISHDRRFLESLSRATLWLDRGQARRVEVGFRDFEAWRDQQLAEEEVQQHKLDRKIVREEHWVRYGVTGRRKRNVRRMAELADLRQQRRDHRRATGKAVIDAAQADKSGALVFEAKNIGKRYGERSIIEGFSTRIMRGDRIGIVGPNGSGKTTMVSMLIGELAPDSGEVRMGAGIEMASLEQDRDSLDPNWTLAEALTRGRGDQVSVGGKTKHVVSYMKDFLFQAEQARTPLRVLSGGERGRIMLARALAKPSNLLVLDEPTNDLDLETLDVLEEMLADYSGTVVLISHDRDFLDRVVHSVIVPEGNGRWSEYEGGYSDMLGQRGSDLSGRATGKSKAAKNAGGSEAAAEKAARQAASAPASKRKLSFKEKHALETLPKQMAALQTEAKQLGAALADPKLYTRDPNAFAEKSARLAAVEAELSSAEDQWLELEMLREEIEGG
ncbi:ABC transporter, ATP-binding protein [Hyphomicrobium sulfonivorans]|uniref:ATP-binding protein Uup n=1 Tax=Hyphomicrobium sulfonivorans TaxID=121290 RepID=A0A109BJN1_HYPSL|nr:ATP-binding cassette domain-containing protein [Hyphomicrobium sulfonivorans]KWT70054.1 ABC transporter, ATP-binding protein [Hyphomicrobium sulfonivorans]